MTPFPLIGWAFGMLVALIGIANLVLVHPVPGIVFLLLSLVYIPPVNGALKQWLGFSIPSLLKIILGFVIIWFTLGISDLGEMMWF